jgi:hypothetical protein
MTDMPRSRRRMEEGVTENLCFYYTWLGRSARVGRPSFGKSGHRRQRIGCTTGVLALVENLLYPLKQIMMDLGWWPTRLEPHWLQLGKASGHFLLFEHAHLRCRRKSAFLITNVVTDHLELIELKFPEYINTNKIVGYDDGE